MEFIYLDKNQTLKEINLNKNNISNTISHAHVRHVLHEHKQMATQYIYLD
jgi:hypothetical protein